MCRRRIAATVPPLPMTFARRFRPLSQVAVAVVAVGVPISINSLYEIHWQYFCKNSLHAATTATRSFSVRSPLVQMSALLTPKRGDHCLAPGHVGPEWAATNSFVGAPGSRASNAAVIDLGCLLSR
jgi:hypothetical protein